MPISQKFFVNSVEQICMIMKNAFLLFIIIFISFTSYGQERFADCRVHILSPADGDTVQYPQWIKVKFSIYNQGPDSIYDTDELVYILQQTNNDSPALSVQYKIGQFIPAGDFVVLVDSVPITRNDNYEDAYVFFGRPPHFWGFGGDRPLRYERGDELEDNKGGLKLTQVKNTASVREEIYVDDGFIVYPNPIALGDVLTLKYPSGETLSDITLINSLSQSFKGRLEYKRQ